MNEPGERPAGIPGSDLTGPWPVGQYAAGLRNRIQKLIRGLQPDDPARILGEREIERLNALAYAGEVRGEGPQPDQRPLPSLDGQAAHVLAEENYGHH